MDVCIRIVVAAAALVVTAAVFGQATAPATGAGQGWEGTLAKLASADFAERAAGQKELEKATWRDRGELKKLADGEADAEVKQRVMGEVEVLDEAMAMDPPPISLDLEGTPAAHGIAALSDAIGVPQIWNGGAGPAVTVHAAEKPFGEVVLAMSQGGVLRTIGWHTMKYTKAPLAAGLARGPFVVWAADSSTALGIRARGGGLPALDPIPVLCYGLAVDPRVTLSRAPVVETTSILDDVGDERAAASGIVTFPRDTTTGWYEPVAPLAVGGGTKIVSVEGVAHFTVQAQAAVVEMPDAAVLSGKTIAVGSAVIRVQAADVRRVQDSNESLVHFSLMMEGGNKGDQPPVTVHLLDEDGKILVHEMISAGGAASAEAFVPKSGNVRVVFSQPTNERILDVPFSLTGLSIPLPTERN